MEATNDVRKECVSNTDGESGKGLLRQDAHCRLG